ncbi:MAG: putative DNA binding domain-containing protein [Synergistaceae bacterium]|jgi:ATP-dependent DNA helicase RecG|nr:putative DNA binding domain-containing protein [Synergistaceae bacterium]
MLKSELMELITNGENSGVEFKQDDIRPEQLAKEIAALANLKGGRVLLGVDDEKNIVGITRANLSEWVADTVLGRYVHPVILPYYEEVVMDDGKKIAVVTIGPGISKPYVVREHDRETAYIRIGSISRPATREQLLTLGSSSGIVHSEAMPVYGTSFESLDMARLENYMRDIIQDPQIPQNKPEWMERLKALGFMTDGITEEPLCTVAGVVLFVAKPRQFLRQSGVRLMVFDAMDKIYQAKLDKMIDAPLVGRFSADKSGKHLIDSGLIEKTFDMLEPFITEESNELNGRPNRDRVWFYPFEALRELLINALAHRDWTRLSDVEITGYLDRIEITSPGALPNSMTVEKVLAGQRSARNHIIVDTLRDYGYVDARGMGVRVKVIPALTAREVKYTYEATEDYVKVVIDKMSVKDQKCLENVKNVGEKIDKRRGSAKTSGKILEACRERETITIPELAALIGRSERSIERNIQKLRRDGLLKRTGGRRGGHWEVGASGANP